MKSFNLYKNKDDVLLISDAKRALIVYTPIDNTSKDVYLKVGLFKNLDFLRDCEEIIGSVTIKKSISINHPNKIKYYGKKNVNQRIKHNHILIHSDWIMRPILLIDLGKRSRMFIYHVKDWNEWEELDNLTLRSIK